MKICTICSIILAAGVSQTDAFGVRHAIHHAAAPTTSSSPRASSSDSFAKNGATGGARSSSRIVGLNMASDTPGENNGEVIIAKDFRLSAIFLGAGLLLDNIPYLQLTLGPLVTVLGVSFLVQSFRLDFVCDDSTFSLQDTTKDDTVGENVIVGGENRWTYDSFVNYDFFPKGWIDQPQGPILVYFKETQTPSDKWSEGPGASANSDDALAKGAVKGQVHFFPALCNTQQLRAIWEKNCSKL